MRICVIKFTFPFLGHYCNFIMRTDSTAVSKEAVDMIKEEIPRRFGKQYSRPFLYGDSKIKGAQNAHECIRVTKVEIDNLSDRSLTDNKLYQLIWKRTMMSQMASQVLDQSKLSISHNFELMIQNECFDGWTILNPQTKCEDVVPDSEILTRHTVMAKQISKAPPPLYTEGTLVKELEHRGVGRPSTYSSMVNLIQSRGYVVLKKDDRTLNVKLKTITLKGNQIVEKESETKLGKQKHSVFRVLPVGIQVISFLRKYYEAFVLPKLTVEMEKDLDKISNGKMQKHQAIESMYNPYVEASKTLPAVDKPLVGDNIQLGLYQNKQIIIKSGKFGPYIIYDNKNYSAGFETILDDVTLTKAIQIIEEKQTKPKTLTFKYRRKEYFVRQSKFKVDEWYVQTKLRKKTVFKPLYDVPGKMEINDLTGKYLSGLFTS